jgi:hypothetical protein
MASFSDTFPSDGDSPGAGWTEQAGCDMDVISGVLRTMAASFADHYAARTDTALAADQYIRFELVNPTGSPSSFPRVGLRYTDATSPFYQLTIDAEADSIGVASVPSVGGAETAVGTTVNMGGANGYHTWGITIEGTGTSTVWRFWTNPVNNTPATVSGWDSAGDTADQSITADPASPVNSGIRIAIGGVTAVAEAIRFDNVFGGDFAGGAAGPEIFAWSPVVRAVRGSTYKTVASGFTPPSDPE